MTYNCASFDFCNFMMEMFAGNEESHLIFQNMKQINNCGDSCDSRSLSILAKTDACENLESNMYDHRFSGIYLVVFPACINYACLASDLSSTYSLIILNSLCSNGGLFCPMLPFLAPKFHLFNVVGSLLATPPSTLTGFANEKSLHYR